MGWCDTGFVRSVVFVVFAVCFLVCCFCCFVVCVCSNLVCVCVCSNFVWWFVDCGFVLVVCLRFACVVMFCELPILCGLVCVLTVGSCLVVIFLACMFDFWGLLNLFLVCVFWYFCSWFCVFCWLTLACSLIIWLVGFRLFSALF